MDARRAVNRGQAEGTIQPGDHLARWMNRDVDDDVVGHCVAPLDGRSGASVSLFEPGRLRRHGGRDRCGTAALDGVSRNGASRLVGIGVEHRGLVEVVRASPHYYNSEAELDRFLKAVDAL